MDNKILLLHDLVKKVEELKKSGKTVVQSHGIFDIIHPGIIAHLDQAKKQGDVLVVTVIKDKDVRRGPGRPIFPGDLRAVNVASLQQVDYVCLVDDGFPYECVKDVKPDVFAKGQTFKERVREIGEKIFEEERELVFGKTRIFETGGPQLSSSHIINKFLDIYPEETRAFLKDFSKKYSFRDIKKKLDSLKDMKVLLIGDGIIDEYHYVEPMNRSSKAHLVVNKYLNNECFSGGVFAIANHLAGFCKDVHMISLLGKEDSKEDFIAGSLRPNVEAKFFYRDDGPTIIKKRYINQYLNQKLFEINFINDTPVGESVETPILAHLYDHIPDFDLVLVSDFGHGIITKKISRAVEGASKILGINTQTNGANAGYNLITKYRNPHYVCLDELEIRLAAQDKFGAIEDVAVDIARAINSDYLIVTRGKHGSLGITKNNEINHTPIFSSKVVDTVGAGDAFFAATAPCFARGLPLDLVSFIGNAVGAIAVQIVGNKRPVEKSELLEFISTILK